MHIFHVINTTCFKFSEPLIRTLTNIRAKNSLAPKFIVIAMASQWIIRFILRDVEFSVIPTLIPYFKIFYTLSILGYNLFSNSAIHGFFDPWIPTTRAKKSPAIEIPSLQPRILAEIDRNCNGDTICLREMDDVKLHPVGTLACCCSAHARRPKRIFIGSHRDRLHAILAHAKRNFTPVTK